MIKCISISSEATDLEQMGHLKPGRRAEGRAPEPGGRKESPTAYQGAWRVPHLHGATAPTLRLPAARSSCAGCSAEPAQAQPPSRRAARPPALRRGQGSQPGCSTRGPSCSQALKGEDHAAPGDVSPRHDSQLCPPRKRLQPFHIPKAHNTILSSARSPWSAWLTPLPHPSLSPLQCRPLSLLTKTTVLHPSSSLEAPPNTRTQLSTPWALCLTAHTCCCEQHGCDREQNPNRAAGARGSCTPCSALSLSRCSPRRAAIAVGLHQNAEQSLPAEMARVT